MKNKVLIILLVVFSLLLAGAIGFGVYLNMNFSTMIFEKGLDKLYTLSNNYLTKANIYDYENEIVQINNTISYNSSDEVKELLGLDSVSLNYNITLDNENRKMLNNISYLEGDKEYLNVDLLYNSSDYSYINLNNLFTKILKVSLDEETTKSMEEMFDTILDNSKTIKDTDRLIYLTIDIIKNNISKDDIIKKDVTITIDGKENKLTEYCYSLEGEKLNNFVINILTEMEKNEEIVNILKNTYKMEDVKLVEYYTNNYEYSETDKLLSSIYVSGKYDIVGFSITEDTGENNTTIKYIGVKDSYLFEVNDNPDLVGIIEGSKDKSGNINLSVKENGEEIGTVKIMEENDEYTFIIDSIDNTKSITLKYRNEKVNEKENNINLEVGIVSDGVSMGIIKFNQNTKVVDKLEEFDYSNAIDVNELTEEDTNELLMNLQEQLGDSVLYTLIIGYSSQFDASNYSSMY